MLMQKCGCFLFLCLWRLYKKDIKKGEETPILVVQIFPLVDVGSRDARARTGDLCNVTAAL